MDWKNLIFSFSPYALACVLALVSGCQSSLPISRPRSDLALVCTRILTKHPTPAYLNVVNLSGETITGAFGDEVKSSGQAARQIRVSAGWATTLLPTGQYMLVDYVEDDGMMRYRYWIRKTFSVEYTGCAIYLGDLTLTDKGLSVGSNEDAFYQRAGQVGYDRVRCRIIQLQSME